MKNTELKIPALRFPEFSGEWEEKRLGEIAKFSKGKNISKADIEFDGEIECIRYGELYTTYGEIIDEIISKTNLSRSELVFSQANDVIIPASGETNIDIATASCVVKNNIALGGDLNIIRSPLNGRFLAYNLNNKQKYKIAALAQGNAVVHLYPNHLEVLSIAFPSLSEQQKIADFLSAVDKRLQLLKDKKTKLEEYKRGVMQRIFSQELRFTRPDGSTYPDWEEKRLGEISKSLKSGGTPTSTNKEYYDGNISFLSISDMTAQGKYLRSTNKKVSKEGVDNSSSWIVPIDSLIYSMYASVGFVSIAKIELAISQAVICVQLKEDYSLEYIYYFLLDFRKNIYRYIETGTQGNINAQIVKNICINLPCLDEQHQIADFLSAIDDKIALLNQQIQSTEQYKKGLLQQMFV